MKRKSIAIDLGAFLTCTLFVTIFDILRNILTAKMLGPYMTGFCVSLLSIPQITTYFNMGIADSMPVLIPQKKGNSTKEEIVEVKNSIFNYSLFSTGIIFLAILVLLPFLHRNSQINAYIAMAGSLVVFWQLKKFFTSNYEAEKEFAKLSVLEFLFGLSVLILSVVLMYYYKAYGFWAGVIIPNIFFIGYYFYDYHRSGKLTLKGLQLSQIRKIIPLGIVMLISSVVYSPFVILAKLYILAVMGPKAVGFFFLAIIIISKISIIPETIASVLMPHISSMHVAENNSEDIYRVFRKAQGWTFVAAVLIALAGFILFGPIVHLILPEYESGIPAAQAMLFACIPYCLIHNANNVLIAVNHKKEYLKALGSMIFLQMIICLILLFSGVTIIKVSWSFFITFSFYAIYVNYKVFKLRKIRLDAQAC